MATSGVEEDAWRLLGAFYDLSGHNPLRPVPIGGPESPPNESAAKTAALEPGSPECDVAVRYLLSDVPFDRTGQDRGQDYHQHGQEPPLRLVAHPVSSLRGRRGIG